jgi:ferredoxin-NADP reductase
MMTDNIVKVRVRATEFLSPTLRRVVLEPVEGALPIGSAGAHVSVALKTGGEGDGKLIRNAYSLVSEPGSGPHYEIIVRRTETSRGGSVFIHEVLAEGHVLDAVVPHNLFPIQSLAKKHLLIGGGVGITPLLSFLPVLRERGARLELHQIAAPDEVAVFQALLAPRAGDDVHIHSGRDAIDIEALLARQPLGTHVYVCGPAALMDRVEASAQALGWPATRVHRENFGAAGGAPFTVELARSGIEIVVGPNESLLQALEGAGVAAPSLCRGGACGECLTRVVSGTPEHRDHFLSDEEKASGAFIMPCVSRAVTDSLVLDL